MSSSLIFHAQTINLLYSVAGLGVLALTLVLFFDYFWNEQKLYRRYVESYVWWIIIVTSVGGVATSLLYSEVFGFVPCSLCWLQRTALYPQALLALVAFNLKDKVFFPLYGIALSVFGLAVAIYQYIYQALPTEVLENGVLPCLADGSADCSKKVIEVFGFVTFPFLSGVLFLFLIVLFLNLRREYKRN
jgi:disulfide bond formation protein DsbB